MTPDTMKITGVEFVLKEDRDSFGREKFYPCDTAVEAKEFGSLMIGLLCKFKVRLEKVN